MISLDAEETDSKTEYSSQPRQGYRHKYGTAKHTVSLFHIEPFPDMAPHILEQFNFRILSKKTDGACTRMKSTFRGEASIKQISENHEKVHF